MQASVLIVVVFHSKTSLTSFYAYTILFTALVDHGGSCAGAGQLAAENAR
jgi:hypothetical protein